MCGSRERRSTGLVCAPSLRGGQYGSVVTCLWSLDNLAVGVV